MIIIIFKLKQIYDFHVINQAELATKAILILLIHPKMNHLYFISYMNIYFTMFNSETTKKKKNKFQIEHDLQIT